MENTYELQLAEKNSLIQNLQLTVDELTELLGAKESKKSKLSVVCDPR